MLNNKQIEYALDSLNNKLNIKNIDNEQKIKNQYNHNDTTIHNIKERNLIINKQHYEIAINKLRTLKSITKSNKEAKEYQQIIITKHKIEWHRKISLAVACILLFLIGSPLGALVKKGGFGIAVLISIFFFIIYHVLSMIGEKAAKDLSLEAFQGMWLANILFLPIAIFLIYKANNDLQIFNISNLKVSIFTKKNNSNV